MRTKKALKNIFFSFGASIILLAMGLVLRRILLQNFDLELVAYDGLLTNIFSLLAIAELGSSGLLNYRMYKAFADQDKERIDYLISMYRMLYRMIGLLMTAACVVIFFLLPVIFRNKVQLWGYFRIMYAIYAAASVSSYFFAYWNTLLIAGQQEYKIVTTQTMAKVFLQTAKAIILWTTRSYILYLFFSGVADIAVNLLVARRVRKEYPDVQFRPVSFQDYRKEGVFQELREVFVSKIAGTLTYSTDNILIMLLFNAQSVAMYNNYVLIGSRVINLFFQLIAPMRASLADMIHKESREGSYLLYQTVDLCAFFLAAIIFVCYGVVFQPAITVFFGSQYLLPMDFVVAYAIQNYIVMKYQAVLQLRGCFGEYKIEQRYTVLGMVINFTASIVLSRFLGLAGIVLGTVLASIALWQNYFLIVDKKFFQKSLVFAWAREAGLFVLAGAELCITYHFTKNIPPTFSGMILCGALGMSIPTLINVAFFARTGAFKSILIHAQCALKRRENK